MDPCWFYRLTPSYLSILDPVIYLGNAEITDLRKIWDILMAAINGDTSKLNTHSPNPVGIDITLLLKYRWVRRSSIRIIPTEESHGVFTEHVERLYPTGISCYANLPDMTRLGRRLGKSLLSIPDPDELKINFTYFLHFPMDVFWKDNRRTELNNQLESKVGQDNLFMYFPGEDHPKYGTLVHHI